MSMSIDSRSLRSCTVVLRKSIRVRMMLAVPENLTSQKSILTLNSHSASITKDNQCS